LAELNERIARINAATLTGPPTTLALLDVEDALRRYWRERREGSAALERPGRPR
jgi:hypothetical protein